MAIVLQLESAPQYRPWMMILECHRTLVCMFTWCSPNALSHVLQRSSRSGLLCFFSNCLGLTSFNTAEPPPYTTVPAIQYFPKSQTGLGVEEYNIERGIAETKRVLICNVSQKLCKLLWGRYIHIVDRSGPTKWVDEFGSYMPTYPTKVLCVVCKMGWPGQCTWKNVIYIYIYIYI